MDLEIFILIRYVCFKDYDKKFLLKYFSEVVVEGLVFDGGFFVFEKEFLKLSFGEWNNLIGVIYIERV